MTRAEKKEYKRISERMDKLGYTQQLEEMMRAAIRDDKPLGPDDPEYLKLRMKMDLEAMGVDTSRM